MSDKPLQAQAAEQHVADAPIGGAAQLAAGRWGQGSGRSRHAPKFRTAVVVLAGLGLASLLLAFALALGGGHRSTAGGDWSVWRPEQSGMAGAQEIADFVAPYYRATTNDQLAVVTAVNLNDPSSPVRIALPTNGATGGLQALPPTGTVAYNLCGVGSGDCSIRVGQASSDRLLLLRREALELALYTFKYLSGVNTVVALLPPGHVSQGCTGICPTPQSSASTPASGKQLNLALAFDRKELQPWLDRPLRTTLPEPLPPTVAEMRVAPESELISIITAHGLFSERVAHAQDGSTLIVLNPLAPQ